MADKRKSLSKCPYWCRRSRRSTPDLLFPYFPGPELFVLSIRSTTQSAPPSQMDWCGPSGPSTSFITPVQSDPIIPISRNPRSDIQRFYQDFRLPNYSLDTFSGRLFDVVSSTTLTTNDVQTELHHAITRLIVFMYVFKFLIFLIKIYHFLSSEF